MAFLPSDFGVEKIGEDSGESVRNDAIEPKEFVGAGDDAGEESINGKIKKR